jgi:hypothetical protein
MARVPASPKQPTQSGDVNTTDCGPMRPLKLRPYKLRLLRMRSFTMSSFKLTTGTEVHL